VCWIKNKRMDVWIFSSAPPPHLHSFSFEKERKEVIGGTSFIPRKKISIHNSNNIPKQTIHSHTLSKTKTKFIYSSFPLTCIDSFIYIYYYYPCCCCCCCWVYLLPNNNIYLLHLLLLFRLWFLCINNFLNGWNSLCGQYLFRKIITGRIKINIFGCHRILHDTIIHIQ